MRVTEWIFLSLRPGAHGLKMQGEGEFLHSWDRCPQHDGISNGPRIQRYKGWFGVEGYSLSARSLLGRQGVLTKEIGDEWPRLVKAASVEVYDPDGCPHVCVPLCQANIWRPGSDQAASGPHAAHRKGHKWVSKGDKVMAARNEVNLLSLSRCITQSWATWRATKTWTWR